MISGLRSAAKRILPSKTTHATESTFKRFRNWFLKVKTLTPCYHLPSSLRPCWLLIHASTLAFPLWHQQVTYWPHHRVKISLYVIFPTPTLFQKTFSLVDCAYRSTESALPFLDPQNRYKSRQRADHKMTIQAFHSLIHTRPNSRSQTTLYISLSPNRGFYLGYLLSSPCATL